ncbi:MAG TPA: UvrD-helicase domain-containing protein [Solirubrobacteraceae bacterium]|nr:UvrD-helicase domain-containing protein [Solirubrobacteraceae bacterium]
MTGAPTSLDAQPFELSGPLPSGVTVLEASAGTGKTFTIAALAARFIAEGAVTLDQLLLVTFTRIATSELRERVRERLVVTEEELARVAAGTLPTRIDDVIDLLAAAPLETVRERRARLAHAIANFDAATIETTHGFCQKVLDGLGTLAETEPSVSFVDNVDDLVREVIDDLYVRRFFRDRDGLAMSRDQADRIARIAIENPTSEIYPLDPRDRTPEAMRRGLARAARDELEARKRALALMTHDDQLTRLLDTLTGPGGDAAIASLRNRYRVVLIDEFQDTDPIQWEIVNRAFGGGQTTLVLIGDPKQAIYAFRGADVYAYLEAAASAGARATLNVNRRSDKALLDGLDALFGQARLGHPGIVYRHVEAAPGHQHPRLLGAPSDKALRVRVVDVTEPSIVRTGSGFPNAESARGFVARDLAADVVALLNSDAEIETRDEEGQMSRTDHVAPGHVAVLVRTHRNAALIQEELEALGVPAVISSSGSVFATPAATDWLRLLEALEQPSHPARARAAALTPLLGWNATRLASATESELETLHQRLHGWARTLREQGISTLAEAILAGGQAAGRLLTLVGGERRLTDLQHVSQLLNAAAGSEQFGVAALTGWLRQRLAAADREGSNDERTRRLDSDADAVQVLTFHRSKGLEFPIVYCPFLWDAGRLAEEGAPVYFHDDSGSRAIDVGLTGDEYDVHLRQHNVEERGEELRLAYVALTRARHQAVIWWASAWYAKDSPLGRLLFAQDAEGNVDWQGGRRPREDAALARFEEIAQRAPHAVAVEPARPGSPARWSPDIDAEMALRRARFMRRIDTAWRRTSYSALTAAAHDAIVASEPEDAGVTDEPATRAAPAPSELPLSEMAAGPQLGTLIHQALQEVEFDSSDLAGTLAEWLTAAVAHRPELLGGQPQHVAQGLALALATPLGGELGSLALAGVPRADRLDELNFELPLAGGDDAVSAPQLSDIGTLLASLLPAGDPVAGYAQRLRDPMLAAALRGYLTGSIDLVLRVRGQGGTESRDRYAIIDYKTNWLGPAGEPLAAAHYAPAALAGEMQRSHYVLQALLYSVALHRYLRWRLADYDPTTDLAGARYLFVRGMVGAGSLGTGDPASRESFPGPRPTNDSLVQTGVFAWRPPAQLVVALSDLLAGGEVL